VRRWIRQGRLVAHNLGGKAGYRIQRRDLQDFLDSMRESAVEGKTGAAA
jgi:excisionase family DNA binding protein